MLLAGAQLASAKPPNSSHGAWIGGFDIGERRIPYILRTAAVEGSPGLAVTLDRIDQIADVQPATSIAIDGDSLRITCPGAGGTPWTFVLARGSDALTGALAMHLEAGERRFPASFLPMATLTSEALDKFAGEYAHADGSRLRLSSDADGFLIAYLPAEGRCQMLFPSGPAAFRAGTGPTRAEPPAIEVKIAGERVEWSQAGALQTYRRVATRPIAIRLLGQSLARGDLAMPLSRIPAGTFQMGQRVSNPEVVRALAMEPPPQAQQLPEPDPVRPTTISRPFLVSQCEVTNAWFAAFVDETGHMTDAERAGYGLRWNGEGFDRVPGMTWRNPGFDAPADAPVVHVSWNDATAFCAWMTRRLEGHAVRLPTEAEWEYACAAHGTGLFTFGDNLDTLDAYAWSMRNANSPQPVGRRQSNAWGLHDMHGNVWEWCVDGHAPLEASPVTDPVGPAQNQSKILRGGSWINGPWSLRTAYRGQDRATLAEPHIGFRIVVDVD